MTVLRQVERVARRLSKRRCWICDLHIHPGDRYVDQSNVDDGRVYSTIAHEQCDGELERDELYEFGWLASEPYLGSEVWQAWYWSRAAFGRLARDLAFLFAQRVHVAMARGAKPEALGDLVAAYSPRRRVAE